MAVDPLALLTEAVSIAQSVDQVVLCAGSGCTVHWSWPRLKAKGSGRSDYELPAERNHQESLQSEQQPRCGHSVWSTRGKCNSSGKLSRSSVKRIEACPAFLSFNFEAGRYHNSNDVFVGYCELDMRRIEVEWLSRYGFSYLTSVICEVQIDY